MKLKSSVALKLFKVSFQSNAPGLIVKFRAMPNLFYKFFNVSEIHL